MLLKNRRTPYDLFYYKYLLFETGNFEEFPKLFELIFDFWLSASEYRQKYDLAMEVLHLWTDRDLCQKNR